MAGRLVLASLALLCLAAAWLGLRAGRVPSETEIIDRYAAQYLERAGAGARATDCVARPHSDRAVRLVVTCAAPDGTRAIFFAGRRGQPVPPPAGPDA